MRYLLLILCWLLVSPGVWAEASRDWDGTDDVVYSAADKTQNDANFSMLVWFNPDTEGEGAEGRIFTFQGTGGYAVLNFAVSGTNQPRSSINLGTDRTITGSTNDITLDVWQFYAIYFVTSTDDSFIYEMNGTTCAELAVQSTSPGTNNLTSSTINLGANATTGTFAFDGSVGYFQWWNSRSINCRESLEAMFFPCSEPNGLVACIPIWGDTTEVDLSGNGNSLPNVSGTTLVSTGPPVSFGHQMPL